MTNSRIVKALACKAAFDACTAKRVKPAPSQSAIIAAPGCNAVFGPKITSQNPSNG
jgi:hypothetical protein